MPALRPLEDWIDAAGWSYSHPNADVTVMSLSPVDVTQARLGHLLMVDLRHFLATRLRAGDKSPVLVVVDEFPQLVTTRLRSRRRRRSAARDRPLVRRRADPRRAVHRRTLQRRSPPSTSPRLRRRADHRPVQGPRPASSGTPGPRCDSRIAPAPRRPAHQRTRPARLRHPTPGRPRSVGRILLARPSRRHRPIPHHAARPTHLSAATPPRNSCSPTRAPQPLRAAPIPPPCRQPKRSRAFAEGESRRRPMTRIDATDHLHAARHVTPVADVRSAAPHYREPRIRSPASRSRPLPPQSGGWAAVAYPTTDRLMLDDLPDLDRIRPCPFLLDRSRPQLGWEWQPEQVPLRGMHPAPAAAPDEWKALDSMTSSSAPDAEIGIMSDF